MTSLSRIIDSRETWCHCHPGRSFYLLSLSCGHQAYADIYRESDRMQTCRACQDKAVAP